MEIIDWAVSRISPIIEKTNKLLDIVSDDMEIINKSLVAMKPLLEQANTFMWLANDSMKNIQPSIDLLVKSTNWMNWTISNISWILNKINSNLWSILNKIKF
jgi:tetrahydromethanopterin S-methyltransferase subunit B